jgi:hypothetical protein
VKNSNQPAATDTEIREIQRRFFVFIVLATVAAGIEGVQESSIADLVGTTFQEHMELLHKAGCSLAKAQQALATAQAWLATRHWSVQLISTSEAGPDFVVNFVDELDSDPVYLEMKELQKRPSLQ